MRISTGMQYYSGTQNLISNQGELYKLQNQLSTGRKILTPSDDPVASTQALLASQSQAINSEHMNSQDIASSQLAFTDTLLGSATQTLQSLLSEAVQAGDGAYTDSERTTLAQDFRAQLNSLVDLANSKSANGDYIFGGYRTNNPPFQVVDNATGYAQYNGDNGSLRLQVASTATVAVTENGSDVFIRVTDQNGKRIGATDPATGTFQGKSVFDAVKDMITYLETPNAPNVVKADYDVALSNMNIAMEHLTRARASVGARESMVSALKETSSNLDTQYSTEISSLTDLDYTQAISGFTQRQTQLQAAQQTFKKVTDNNLFSYM